MKKKDGPALLLALLACASATCASLQPFRSAETAAAVAKRQSCLTNFFSCADQGAVFSNVCCQNGQKCALDASNNPACCPANAVCTGTAPASFVTPSPAAATTAVSYVPNSYFSFPYAATSFADAGDCSAAVSQCSANYAACTGQLEGQGSGGGAGSYPVTIAVPGGGGTTVTAQGSATVGSASATSICNSLSSAACSGLQTSMCTMSGTSASGFYFGTGTGNFAARPTAAPVVCAGLAGAVAAGLGVIF